MNALTDSLKAAFTCHVPGARIVFDASFLSSGLRSEQTSPSGELTLDGSGAKCVERCTRHARWQATVYPRDRATAREVRSQCMGNTAGLWHFFIIKKP